ncbi:MAG: efflux RND transporter periplasmic adaptor subunit [Selenomonadaceae bacterium]|nr:efflux RND transporter periplasmic adaptor subunit [Selenomonadaceae bacterium]
MRKFWIPIFLTTIFLIGCSKEQPPVEVKTEKILSANDSLTLIYDGKISVSNEIKIFSPVAGNVIEKYIEDGSDIAAGQKLFKVNNLESHKDFLQVKRELAMAKTALSKALVENNPDAAELQIEIDNKQALVQRMEEDDDAGIIYAPKAGRLGAFVAPMGMPVVDNETLLTTIGNINPVAVNFEISEIEKQALSTTDLKVSLKLEDGTTRNGAIKIIDNKTAQAIFENLDETLILGSPAQIIIDNVKIQNALLVAEKAVRHADNGDFVYINLNGKAAVRKIQLGDKIGTYCVVADGLTADDSIIIDGFENLREGTSLNVTNDK